MIHSAKRFAGATGIAAAVAGPVRCARMKSRVTIGSSKITCPFQDPTMKVVVNGWLRGGSSGELVSTQCSPMRGTVIPAGVVLSRTWVEA